MLIQAFQKQRLSFSAAEPENTHIEKDSAVLRRREIYVRHEYQLKKNQKRQDSMYVLLYV